MTTTSIKLFALSMEMLDADTINLEQDAGYGQVDQVQLHRSQVVLLAKQFGLIGQCDVGAVKRLQRQLLLLNTKAEQLADWLLNVTSDRNQDLSAERAMAMALSDFASEFVADFRELSASEADTSRTDAAQAWDKLVTDFDEHNNTPEDGVVATPEIGGLQGPRKRGSSSAPQQPDLLEQTS